MKVADTQEEGNNFWSEQLQPERNMIYTAGFTMYQGLQCLPVAY